MWLSQFDPERVDYKFLDREHNFRTILDEQVKFDEKLTLGKNDE